MHQTDILKHQESPWLFLLYVQLLQSTLFMFPLLFILLSLYMYHIIMNIHVCVAVSDKSGFFFLVVKM